MPAWLVTDVDSDLDSVSDYGSDPTHSYIRSYSPGLGVCASVLLSICASAPTSVEFLKNPQPQRSTAFNNNDDNNKKKKKKKNDNSNNDDNTNNDNNDGD